MSISSDLAELSSLRSQIGEISRRITEIAEKYGISPDSAVASDLYSVERLVTNAGRALARAEKHLQEHSQTPG